MKGISPRLLLVILTVLFWLDLPVTAQNVPTLEAAHAEAAAGHGDRAAEIYRELLKAEPDNTSALSELADLLQATGRWRDALPLLQRLSELQPSNAGVLFQLGRMKSWQGTDRAGTLDLLHRACESSNHDPEYCTMYADVLSWNAGTRPEALANLRSTLAAHPESVSSRTKLAQILSWNEATRPEAMRLLDDGLRLDPNNSELLVASAEMLSWSRATRTEAQKRYSQVLKQDPNNARALAGEAQALAGQGRSEEALTVYDRILAQDTSNPSALRGKAEILNWKGRYAEARELAERAYAAAPNDERIKLELARADVGLQQYAGARDVMRQSTAPPGSDFDQVRQQVRRGLGTYIDVGYTLRRNRRHLDYDRFLLALSTPLNPANRITFSYQPTLFETRQQGFNSNYFGVALDSQISENATTHAELDGETFPNAPSAVDGAFELRYKLRPSLLLETGFQRQSAEESLLSTRGEQSSNGFIGQVRSNLGNIGLSYNNSAHHYDFSVTYADGVYTGHNLNANRRYGMDADIGKSVRSDRPYIRVAYGVSYMSFDFDADTQPGAPLSRSTGGYFSPTRFLLNQGMVNLSHKFGSKVEWDATGTAGAQNVESRTASFSTAQFASSFNTHWLWRLNAMNELRFGYEYLNVFNAFRRNLVRVAWRHYF